MTISGMSTGQLDSLMDLRYTYDGAGNVLTIKDYKMGGPQTQTFTYDDLYRLQTASAAGGYNQSGNYVQETYNYDAATGNLASKAGVSYTYADSNHDHAVTALSNGSSFAYDANGNMTTRQVNGQTFNLSYDAENHMTGVTGAATASFTYNGDGQRLLSTQGGVTTVFIGNYYEWTGSTTTAVKYYYAGTARVAMRRGSGAVTWLMSDHLSSTSVIYDGTTALHQGYKPWGETRFGDLGIRYQFTGQAREPSFGLDFFEARWYDSRLGRFVEADSIIPEASQGTQAWDRYAYTNNNPLRYTDPSGHFLFVPMAVGAIVGAVVGAAIYTASTAATSNDWNIQEACAAAGVGLVGGALIGTGIGAAAGAASLAAIGAGAGVLGGQAGYSLTAGSSYNSGDMALTAAVSGVAGAVTGGTAASGAAVATATSVVANASASAAQYALTELNHGNVPNLYAAAKSAAVGGAIGFVAGQASQSAATQAVSWMNFSKSPYSAWPAAAQKAAGPYLYAHGGTQTARIVSENIVSLGLPRWLDSKDQLQE